MIKLAEKIQFSGSNSGKRVGTKRLRLSKNKVSRSHAGKQYKFIIGHDVIGRNW